MLDFTPVSPPLRTIFIVVVGLVAIGGGPPTSYAGAYVRGASRNDPRAVLVRLRPGMGPLAGALPEGAGSRIVAGSPAAGAAPNAAQGAPRGLEGPAVAPLALAASQAGVAAVEAPFADILVSGTGATPGAAAGAPPGAALAAAAAADRLSRTYRFVLAPGADPLAAARALLASPEVEAASPEPTYSALWTDAGARLPATGPASGPVGPGFLPDDPLFADGTQWGLSNTGTGQFGGVAGVDVGAPLGWAVTTGSTATIVSIVDTGFDLHHPELAAHFSDGRPRVIHAFNGSIEGPYAAPDDSVGHGTLVAGVALALTNNGAVLDGTGVAGMIGGAGGDSMGCRVIEVKATPGAYTDALASELARSIVYAVNNGARAINLSFGGDDDNDTVLDAISYAETHGAVVVCGAGNSTDDRPQYPGYYARYGNGVSVAALSSDGSLARFSTRGPQIDVAAPGDNIMSTYLTYENAYQSPFRDFLYSSGTSFAAPFVTGLAGLAATLQPSLADNEFQEMLRRTARDLGAPGRDDTYGWGIPDAPALLTRLSPPNGFIRGSVAAQSWTAVGQDSVTISRSRIEHGGCEVDGRWLATRYEVRAHVTLPPGLALAAPDVIVHPHGSNGWGPGPLLEYDLGWGEAVPGSVTPDGFDLRAYVYYVAAPPALCSIDVGAIGYVPVQPKDVRFDWAAFTRLDAPPTLAITAPAADGAAWPVDAPDTLRWTASDPDTITSVEVSQSLDGGAHWSRLATLPGTARALAYQAPCQASWENLVLRVRVADDHGALRDATQALRFVSPDRQCLAGENPVAPIPFDFYPVAPNPSLAGGTFRMLLPATRDEANLRRASLIVYDARGRVVRSYVFGEDVIGPLEVKWDGRDTAGRRVPPGVYYARVTAWGTAVSRRFAIVGSGR